MTIRVTESGTPPRVHVTLDRPEVRNAIDVALVHALHEVCARLEAEPAVLIISGGADVFASGADLRELLARGPEEGRAGINRRLFDRIAALPMPTIACVAGKAIGGGAELAYACDFRIGTPSTRFSQPEVQLGLVPASGACYRLPALIGVAAAKRVLLAGASLDADEALACGLLGEVVAAPDLLVAAHRLADRLLQASPLALQLTKACIDAGGGLEDTSQAVLFAAGDKTERIQALLDR